MDISDIRIHCIKCEEPQQVKIDNFDKGQFITCKKCGTTFNVFGVYLSFYNGLPIARKIVDALTSEIGVKYLVESPDPSDGEKIENFFKENQFHSLLKDIVFDTVIFGNSFVEKIPREEKIILQRIDPTMIEVETSWQKSGGFALIEGIKKLVQHHPKQREISRENIVHFSGEPSSHEPLGFSVYGFWFHTWYLLKYAPDESLWKYARNGVVIGSGVPLFMIDSTIKVPQFFQMDAMTLFNLGVQKRRKRIARTIEREIFPLVLDRPFDFDNYPRFRF